MQTAPTQYPAKTRRAGFTLIELMIASTVSIILIGSVLVLLIQSVKEQRLCLACATVEEKAALLQANICSCLRSNSAGMGITPDGSTAVSDANGNFLGYHAINFYNVDLAGSSHMQRIAFDPASGIVTYIPSAGPSGTVITWWTNTHTAVLSQLLFNVEQNPDLSLNSSVVSVRFEINDNLYSSSYSHAYTTNSPLSTTTSLSTGPASIYRSFSVKLRSNN